jgi:pyruvate-ferredoxin/flavodoxin oxidoreductase
MKKNERLITDGNWAAADVAYRLSEFMAIYPITPSSTMGELADEWNFQHKKNIWGQIPGVLEMQSEGGAAGALHGALQMGSLCSTFTASQGLLLMVPNMFKIAGEQTPFVMHVAARAVATHALSIFGDHSDVMSVRGAGFAMLSSHSVQQAHDMALVSHAATLRAKLPFLHFFDGFRTSHEESRLDRLGDEILRKMIPEELVLENRRRGMSPSRPAIRGTAQNPDVYFQGREAANPLYDALPAIVQGCMDELADLTGRKYNLVDYVGPKNAENIFVAMGSACETIEETLVHLPKDAGLVKIHLFNPFPVGAFLAALPAGAKNISVLDRTKEPGSAGEPLFQSVASVLADSGRRARLFGGRYGLGSKEFKPRDAKAVYDNMTAGGRREFVVGITDDLSGRSLETDAAFANDDAGYKSAILFGIGSDGTVGAVKNIVKIIGDNSELYPQSYAVYDSKKSGGLTASHLRFAPSPIRSQYLVEYADFISVSNYAIAQRHDVFAGLKPGGTVMINTSLAPDEAFANLPRAAQERLLRMRARVFALDANKGARELGLGNRINTFIMINFFNLLGVIDPKIAVADAKAAIEKTYKKKGMEIVEANWAAVDRAAEYLAEIAPPSSPSNFAPDFIPAMAGAPLEIAGTLGEIAAQRGDSLTTRDMAKFPRGEFPTGTSRFEKRRMATHAASVDIEKCIQCGKCGTLCPHAAIRFHAGENIGGVPMRTAELGAGLQWRLDISPADCTGCGVCVKNCPVKALALRPIDGAEARQAAFDEAVSLPDFPREKLNLNLPKHIGLLPHYFEFPGACAGCGETPYIRMLAHLFGDKMVVANATGCSSIYGGNLPTTPWAKDAGGRGPAWSNSLFEDNAEYGLGMRMALNQNRAMLKSLMLEIDAETKDDIIKSSHPKAEMARSLIEALDERSVWIIGGDGWAYDIGYGGLDHVMHSGQNVNVLVLDTEGYSNTGGQQSKSTPFGASMKFAVGGKERAKKDLGLIAMMSGAYVAEIALGANPVQAAKAFQEAEAFDGPSVILAYSPCIAHGFALENGVKHQEDLVRTGAWPLYRFNPKLLEEGKNPLIIDSPGASLALEEFMKTENRFAAAEKVNKSFGKLVESAKFNNDYRARLKQHIADFAVSSRKDNGEG